MTEDERLKRPVCIANRCYWVGKYIKDEPFQCHPYFIENGDESILIDPGGVLEIEKVIEKINMLRPLHDIKYIVLHHQDPDLAASVPLLEKRIERDDLHIVTHSRMTLLLEHYGIVSDFYEIDKHAFKLVTQSGLQLRFLTTPYCHSPGAFVTYHPEEKVLFSGDIFGGMEKSWQLYADENYFEQTVAFHKAYMPGRDIFNYSLRKIERLDMVLIAPQHGSLIREPYIRPLIKRLKELECGLYIEETYKQNLIDTIDRLREETLKNELILEASPNAVIAVNEKKEVILFNKKAEEMFGYTKEEMLGNYSLPKIVPPRYLKAHERGLNEFLQCESCTMLRDITLEFEGLRKNGEMFPIRIRFGTYKHDGTVIIVANIEDTTQEKRQEEILKRQTHLAQMGEMLGMIAHQWRQPLSAIAMTSQVLAIKARKDIIDKEILQQSAEKIDKYTRFLNRTIEDFRNFFKPDNEKEYIRFDDIVTSVIEIVLPQLQKNHITLKTYLACNDRIVTYGNELKQVLLNLIKNAEDVFEERHIKDPRITIETYKNQDGTYTLSVSDNGGGIDKEILPLIFDIYFTTKDKRNGTGMGLYMSKIIVEEHCRGKLFAENTNEGARFRVAVPSLEHVKAKSTTQAREN
jgi:PAS domain S-box-containing protein